MIEHLGNCHGEWNSLFYLLATVPFIGPWLFMKLRRKPKDQCPCGHGDGEHHA